MPEPTGHPAPSERATVRRSDRGSYDRDTIDSILDEAMVAHVGFLADDESPVVVPMLHARIDSDLYLHGGHASRIMRTLRQGSEICVTVTILDGLVLARSAFHHSANYRSVIVFGRPLTVEDLEEKAAVLDAYTDKIVPGRRPHLRPMTEKEVRATTVVALPIHEASAKIRSGPPIDDEADLDLDIWAGVIPLSLTPGHPVADDSGAGRIPLPDHVRALAR